MAQLKQDIGKLEIPSMGIVVTHKTSSEECEYIVKKEPSLAKYFDNLKSKQNDKDKNKEIG